MRAPNSITFDNSCNLAPTAPTFDPSIALNTLQTRPYKGPEDLCDLACAARDVELKFARELTPSEKTALINTWFDASPREYLPDAREDYLVQFCLVVTCYGIPLAGAPLVFAWKRASARPIPTEAEDLTYPIGRLAGLCAELQRLSGTSSFLLGTRCVAELFQVRPGVVQEWVRALKGFGLLRVIRWGSWEKGRPAEYLYTGASGVCEHRFNANPILWGLGLGPKVAAVPSEKNAA